MTVKKFRLLCLFIFLSVYIPVVFFAPKYVLNPLFWTIGGWKIGELMFALSDKLAVKFGYSD